MFDLILIYFEIYKLARANVNVAEEPEVYNIDKTEENENE